jgi:putative nucleotidyltransferase with HDIG domain
VNVKDRVVSWLASQDVDAYLAGGCVRDQLLGRAIYDLDVAVAGDGLALARRLADSFDADYYTLDSERGTGRAILRREDGERLFVDVARLRGRDLTADLAGRDFTVNALAVDVRSPEVVIDNHNGLADLEAGLIRAVSEDAIRSDPLRALRALRQAAQLGFALEPQTEVLIQRDGTALEDVSAERLCDELSKLLACASSAPFLFELDRLGLLCVIMPELEPLRDLEQPVPHRHRVLKHSLETVGALEFLLDGIGCAPLGCNTTKMRETGEKLDLGSLPDHAQQLSQHLNAVMSDTRPRVVTLKMAALLHDIGKPIARTVDEDGRMRFLGHEAVGSSTAGEVLQRLRFSSVEARLAEIIVRNHMRPLTLASQDSVSSRAVYRFFRDSCDAGIDILLHALADHLATYAFETEGSDWQQQVALVARMLEYYWDGRAKRAKPSPLISGRDLLRDFGLQPGPQIGRLLEAVREAQAIGEVRTHAEAMALVSSVLED